MADHDFREDFEPAQWGPHAWNFLHTVTYSYPVQPHPELQRHMRDFFWNLRSALPCRKCRRHYEESFVALEDAMGDPFRSKAALTQWLVALHNRVNHEHGKTELTPRQAERIYTAKHRLCGMRAARSRKRRRLSMVTYVLALLLLGGIACVAVVRSCRQC